MPRCFNCMQQITAAGGVCPVCGHSIDESQTIDNALPTGALIADRFTLGFAKERDCFGFRYIAYDNSFEKTRTVKEYFPDGASRNEDGYSVTLDKDRIEEFYQENKRLEEYDYFESVLKIYGCEKENGTLYVITEHPVGETLSRVMEKRGQFTFKETVNLMRPVLTALCGLHNAGIYHGSISPDNLFVCENDKVKLLNIGTSVISENFLADGFTPKEQYSNPAKINEKTDIYSICAVMYYMLTGNIPADSRNRDTERDSFVPLFGIADIPPRAEDALMKGLSVNPDGRQESVEDILNDLLGRVIIPEEKETFPAVEQRESADSQTAESEKSDKKHSRKALVAVSVLAAILGLALIGLAVYIMPRISQDEPEVYSTTSSKEEITTQKPVDENNIIFRTEAMALYDAYFKTTDFKTDYERDYAIRIKDDDLFKNSTEFPRDVKSLENATAYQTYLDIDADNTVECIWCSDLNGKQKYVDVYIFDLDENREVFEGGRIAYSSGGNEDIELCTAIAGGESIYYFLRSTDIAYNEDSENRRCFEILWYNGSELICTASAGAERSSSEPFCFTGVVPGSDGTLWNPSSPSSVKSVYIYDSERHVQSSEDYTVVDQAGFETIWNKNVLAVNKKIPFKAIEIIDTSVEVSVTFPGMLLEGRDVELTRVTPTDSEVFLYTCDGRPMQFVRMLDRRDFAQPYRIEIYYNEMRYCVCTVTLDEDFKPVYNMGNVELKKMPDVRGLRRNEAIDELKDQGFTKIYTSNGSRPGLLQMSRVGKVESQNIEPGEYISADTEIKLKVYRAT